MIHVLAHHELVALNNPLGSRRMIALKEASAAARDYLTEAGYEADICTSFAQWKKWESRLARPHYWFALPHDDLNDDVVKAILLAAKVYCDKLAEYHE